MNRSRQRTLLPHYVAVLGLSAVAVGGVRVALGDLAPWVALLTVLVVVLAYPTVVRLLGVAPEYWDAR